MEVVHARCAGLDVHKQTVVACVRVTMAGPAHHEVRTFATTAADLRALQEWLVAARCPPPRLGAKGGYWKTGWHPLQGDPSPPLAHTPAGGHLPRRPPRPRPP